MNVYKIALASATLLMMAAVDVSAAPVDRGLQGGSYNAGRGGTNCCGGDRGGWQGGDWNPHGIQYRNNQPPITGAVPRRPGETRYGGHRDPGGLQDGGSRGNHRDDRNSGNNRSNGPR